MSQELREMTVPIDCFAGIGEVWKGDYGCSKIQVSGKPSVVDIGANIGAFAMWAMYYLKASSIICYEPNPSVFPYLAKNLGAVGETFKDVHVEAHQMAVGDPKENVLIQNTRSRMQSSQYEISGGLTAKYEVRVLEPKDIPPCNVLKMDCEGAEAYICENLQFIPDYLVCETHNPERFQRVINALIGKMKLVDVVVDVGNDTTLTKFIKCP